ncbi:MAG: hypothetical protein ABI634_02545 [Acidobacteriota bacterium]
MRTPSWTFLAIALCLTVTTLARDLKPATLKAYERYVALTEQRLAGERAGSSPFLWIDRQPPPTRDALMTRLRQGEVVTEQMQTLDQGRSFDVDDGMIHHWIGSVMMPNVPVDRALSFVQAYDNYPRVFDPMIQRARVLSHDGDHYVVSMRTSVKKVITVVMDIDYVVDYHRLSPTRVWTTNLATNIYQVQGAGTGTERRVPADQTSGFLWRFWMSCGFDQRPEGSLEQCESITLTRGIPFGVSWFIKPFVTGVPREFMTFTLSRVRANVVQ